ncbi:MAG: GspE/PulE family protein [Candidatus Saccharimonadia bacterium]
MLAVETQKIFERLLVERKLLTQADIDLLRLQSVKDHKSVLSLIAEQKLVPVEDLVRVTAEANGVPYANLHNVTATDKLLNIFPKELAKSYMAVPFGQMRGRIAVGMLDAANVQAIDFISRKVGQPVAVFMVSEDSVNRILSQYRADVSKEVSDVIGAVASIKTEEPKKAEKANNAQVANLVQDAPITRALNTILDYAAQSRASDIHIEPREKELKIRFRIDGLLQDTMTLPKDVEPALISRIKILSNLKIDEHRIPQDGQFQMHTQGRDIDLRIAIAPVVNGEQVVIRLLDKEGQILTLDALGFRGQALKLITVGIHRPHGMTLSTGPTGSGKSTTLYAIIAAIKSITTNIVTLEDPVEYKMDGINQMQINPEVGLTFASGLRSILRQDPNVVMVGEIRDKETADLAVQAALTGHVVLSTLHTNSSSGVLPRLLDMGVEPFLISSTVNTAIGQRLVRKVCDNCKEEYESSMAETESIKKALSGALPKTKEEVKEKAEVAGYDSLPLADQNAYTLYKGKGCSECQNGFKGRMGIYEVFGMTPAMEKLLVAHATTTEIQDQAQKDGMLTMKQDGYLKALAGLTTLEEVARVAADY